MVNGFFDNPFEIADYVRGNDPEGCAHAIRVADEVTENRFKFDLRWDMERTAEYVEFGEEIDWLYQPGSDPEWVYMLNRMRYWVCLGQAYALTKDEKYANTFVKQMTHWVRNAGKDNPKNAKAWRSIEAGLRLESWLKALEYFRESPAVTPDVLDIFYKSIIEQAEYLMSVTRVFHLMSNWGVLSNSGLFMAGLMLPQTARTTEYASEALKQLEAEIIMQVYRDGSHWEQSPMYHNEVLNCYLNVITLAKRLDFRSPKRY